MKKNVIYHNPRCSKSRQTLKILQDKGIDVEIVEYLNNPPTENEIEWICSNLSIKAVDLIRTKEGVFKELNLSLKDTRSEKEWFKILTTHPILIERPIVIYQKKAVIGRPPENVLQIL